MKQNMRFIFLLITVILSSIQIETQAQSISNTSCDTTLCSSSTFNVSFTATGFSAGTVFVVALSDASGQFTSPTQIGQGLISPINCVLNSSLVSGNQYRIIVGNTSNPLIMDTIDFDLTILATDSFHISLSSSATNICANTNVDFIANSNVDSVVYTWFLNGTQILGDTDSLYSNSTLTATSDVYVEAEAFGQCLLNTVDISDTIQITVGNTGTLPFDITASASPNVICQGDNVTLTSTTLSGSGNLTYNWSYILNGNTVSIGTTNPITTNIIPVNATVKVVVTSDAACLANSSDSAIVNLTINTTSSPSIAISQNIRFCDNPEAYGRFIASPLNSAYTYVWYIDGIPLPTQPNPNELLIQTKNVSAGQIVTCKVTTNNPCSANNTATSNQIVIEFLSTPSIVISDDFTMKFGEEDKYVEVISGEIRPNSIRWNSDYTGVFENPSAPKTEVSPKLTQQIYFSCIATNGCPVNLDLTITVIPDKQLFIPDIFSPNLDGNNDIFFIRNRANQIIESTFLLQIFDEFGTTIFESKYQNYGWDGTYKNKPCKEGAYIYKVSGMYTNSEPFEQTNKIILIR